MFLNWSPGNDYMQMIPHREVQIRFFARYLFVQSTSSKPKFLFGKATPKG